MENQPHLHNNGVRTDYPYCPTHFNAIDGICLSPTNKRATTKEVTNFIKGLRKK